MIKSAYVVLDFRHSVADALGFVEQIGPLFQQAGNGVLEGFRPSGLYSANHAEIFVDRGVQSHIRLGELATQCRRSSTMARPSKRRSI